MEDRINQIISEENADRDRADTFADRADAYYRRRPRLISLLHDLYNDYVSLSDRYTRALTKLNTHHHHHHHPSPSPPPSCSFSSFIPDDGSVSDAESTISFQPTPVASKTTFKPVPSSPNPSTVSIWAGADAVVAELVMRSVEYEFLKNEMELQTLESGRKIELQRSLVEVLESERMVLLGENSRLVYKAEILSEERNAAFSENAFLRTRMNQMGKCVMRLEEERRGVVLSRQIEDLQRQIHSLEMKGKNGCGGGGVKCSCGVTTPPRTAEERRKWGGWWRRLRKGPCGSCTILGQVG